MSRRGTSGSSSQYGKGLTYISNTPKFLQNFGQAQPQPPSSSRSPSPTRGRGGREELPSRPREGKWAEGSDDESKSTSKGEGKSRKGGKGNEGEEGEEDEEEDEWEQNFGGGADGPQIVVLKEGRHLSEGEVKRLRRKAKGEPSPSPPPPKQNQDNTTNSTSNKPNKPSIIPKSTSTNKRKLVGNEESDKSKEIGKMGDGEKKKKKKAKKGMLSFNEAEGEE